MRRLRAVLVAILLNGLVPAFGEAAEAVVHLAQTGHLAHSAADDGDLGDQGREHGCGSTDHRCVCCPNLAAAAAPAPVMVSREEHATDLVPAVASCPRARSLEPPFRPPIA
jgi:hypothetical protein